MDALGGFEGDGSLDSTPGRPGTRCSPSPLPSGWAIPSTAQVGESRIVVPRISSTRSHRSIVFGVHPDIRLLSAGGGPHMTATLDTELVPVQALPRPALPQLQAV